MIQLDKMKFWMNFYSFNSNAIVGNMPIFWEISGKQESKVLAI